MNRKSLPFFCDECGVELSTGEVCFKCKRVLCHKHFHGTAKHGLPRKDGLCAKCAAALRKRSHEEVQQT